MLNVVMLCVVMLNVIMLSAIMLSVVMLNVVMLSVVPRRKKLSDFVRQGLYYKPFNSRIDSFLQ
jgi:hypothetical protein